MVERGRPDRGPQASDEQFRLLVEQVQDYAIYLIDPEGRVASWNRGAERIKGYRAAEIVGRPYSTFFTASDQAARKPDRLLRRAREEGRVEDEGWRVRKDGSRFWADAVLTALRDPAGHLRGYAKVTRDMTERRRGDEQRFLAEVGRELAASLDLEATLPRVAGLVVPRLADWCTIDVLDDSGLLRRLAVAPADWADGQATWPPRRIPTGPEADVGVPRALRSGQTQFYPELSESLGSSIAPGMEPRSPLEAVSALVVPLLARGRSVGALTLVAAPGRSDAEYDRALAEDLGQRIALAVDNAALFAAEQRAREAAERLARIVQQVGASLSPEVVLEQIVAAAGELLGSTFAGVFLLDAASGDFALAAGHGLALAEPSSLRLPRDRSLARRAVAQRRAIQVDDVAAEPGTALPALLSGEPIGSLVVAPIVAGAEALGVIEVYAVAPRAFVPGATSLLTGLAAAAAAALANARLYRRTQEQVAAQAALNQALQEVATARDRARAQAESERERLHELFRQAPAAIAETRGPEHPFTFANPVFLRLVGRDPAEVLGHPAREALPQFADQGMVERSDRTYRTGEPWVERELRVDLRREGATPEEAFFHVVIQPLRDPDEAVAGLQVYALEVTEQVRARQRVEELAAERDAFLAAASHDLKNPLAAIKGTAQFLRRQLARAGTIDPGRLATGLATIEETDNRMVELVEQLLDVTRLRLGQRLDLDRRPADLVTLARRVAAAQQQATERHEIRVESETNELVGNWDAARLGRVLGNLLDNAVKYSPHGGEIVVELAKEGVWAVLQVRDPGIGIPRGDRERIFAPFQRGSNVAGVIAGTGIGLAGSKQIVEQHGGSLTVESRKGDGSTFTVRLPLTNGDGPS